MSVDIKVVLAVGFDMKVFTDEGREFFNKPEVIEYINKNHKIMKPIYNNGDVVFFGHIAASFDLEEMNCDVEKSFKDGDGLLDEFETEIDNDMIAFIEHFECEEYGGYNFENFTIDESECATIKFFVTCN